MVYVLLNAKNNEVIEVFSEIAPVFKYILQNNSTSLYVDMVKANKIYVHCAPFGISGGHELKPEYIIVPTKIKN